MPILCRSNDSRCSRRGFNLFALIIDRKAIEKWIKEFKPQSIIDYGCGKGGVVLALKENYSSIDTIGYDPGMVDFKVKPTKKFDMLISTDVLEHIEPVFLDAVLKEMNQYFTKNAFLIIATSPAKKFLPDGRNAHLIVETPGWWKHKLETLREKLNNMQHHMFSSCIHANVRSRYWETLQIEICRMSLKSVY